MAYLKNLAESLAKKSLPTVAKSVFRNENNKLTDFEEKLAEASEIFDKAKSDITSTAGGFAGIGPVGKKFRSQLKSGKFGTTTQEVDDAMMKSMGFDFSDMDSIGVPDSSESSEGDDTPVVTNNKVTNNFTFKSPSSSLSNITKGDALINEKLSMNQAVAVNLGRHQIGLLSNIGFQLESMVRFMTDNTQAHYASTMEYYSLQASMTEKSNELSDLMMTHYKEELERKSKARARELGMDDAASILDPARMMSKITDGNFSLLFGEMSPIKGALEGFSSDPLGTMLAAGAGAAISNLFSKQVDGLKDFASTLEYRVQDSLENMSRSENEILKSIGNMFKLERDNSPSVSLGQYDKGEAVFDGQTRKAIIDVIPMYLSKILKAISGGKNHEVYDYEKGAFISDHKGARELKRKTLDIEKGNFGGGIGRELNYSFMNDGVTLSKQDQAKIRKALLKKALDSDASSKHIKDVDLGDTDLTAKFQAHIAGLNKEELRDMNRAFSGHRFDRSNEMRKLQSEIQSTGIEQSAILYGGKYDLRQENVVNPTVNPGGGGPNPGPIPPIPGPNGPNPPIPGPNGPNPGGNPGPGGGPNGPSILDRIKKTLLNAGDKTSTFLNDSIGNPFKRMLFGKKGLRNGEDSDSMSLIESFKLSFSRRILTPFKRALLGTTDSSIAESTSLWSSIKDRFEKSILMPLKTRLLGSDKDLAKQSTFFSATKVAFNEKILDPMKQFMLGKDVDSSVVKNTSFFSSIKSGLERTIFMPLKSMLVGDKAAGKMTLFGSISKAFNHKIIFPMKKALLGDETDTKTILKTSLLKSVAIKFDESILFPLKSALLGGNDKKASKMNLMQVLGRKFETSVLFPVKNFLLGSEKRSKSDVWGTSFIKSMSIGFTEKVLHPMNEMLFGKDKRKEGFFKNLGTTFSPFFNKLLFGADKSSKFGFVENLKKEGGKLWSNVYGGFQEKFLSPLTSSIKELFGPVFSDFKNVLGEELKHYGKQISGFISFGIKEGGKGLFKNVFGDETVKLLRDNVITPLKDLTSKLTEHMSKAFKFLFRMPLNFVKGITNTMKLNQINQGRGNHSPEEVARLQKAQKEGKLFNFMDMGEDSKDGSKKKGGFFSRLRERSEARKAGTDGKVSTNTSANSPVNQFDPVSNEREKVTKLETISERLESLKEITKENLATIRSALGIKEKAKPSDINTKNLNGANSLNSKSISESADKNSNSTSSGSIRSMGRTMTMESALPTLVKGATDSSRILAFMQSNLSKVDNRLENVIKLLRKLNGGDGDISGIKGSSGSIFRNPFQWAANKVQNLFSFATNAIGNALSSVGKVVQGIISIPGKIAGSMANMASSILNGAAKAVKGVIDTAGFALQGVVKFASNALPALGTALGKVVSGMADAVGGLMKGVGTFVSNIAGPLSSALGSIVSSLAKNMVPLINSFATSLTSATSSLLKFGNFLLDMGLGFTKGAMTVAGRMLGRGFGMGGGRNSVSSSESKIVNYTEIAAASKMSPLHVYVVDGKIGTYAFRAKSLKKTSFIDNIEDRLSGKGSPAANDEKDKKGGLLSKLGGLLSSVFGGTALGGIFTKLATKLGGAKDLLGGGKLGKLGKIFSRTGGKAVASNATKAIATQGVKTAGQAGAVKAAGSFASKGLGARLAGAAKGVVGGGAGGLVSKLAKGAGIGAVVSIGGNMLADTMFEKGSLGNDLVGDASTYAGYGALAGSIVPGIGTAVGALVGGLIGAVKVAVPRAIKWIENKFSDQIRSATESFIKLPEKIGKWADELPGRFNAFAQSLPEKLTAFFNDLPSKIVGLFSSENVTVDSEGQVIEDKPSILGRLFVAVGQAMWGVAKSLPKIFVSLNEGIAKMLVSAVVTGITGLAKGIYTAITGVSDIAGKMFDTIVVKARSYVPSMLGGLSEEEAKSKLLEIDKKYEQRAVQRESNLKDMGKAGSSTAKFLTNWSVADKMGSGGKSGISANADLYSQSVASSGGDDAKALKMFAEKAKLNEDDAKKEFELQKGEAAHRYNPNSSTIDAKGYSMNSVATGNAVKDSGNYSSDPGLFTNDDVNKAIKQASLTYGIPESTLHGIAQIESTKRYWVTNKSGYAGLFQMGKDEFARFSPNPSGSRLDPYLNSMAAANYMAYHAKHLKDGGIPVTPENIYVAHQQGLGGIRSIYKAAQGIQPLPANIASNMLNNPPHDGKGKTNNPRDFLNRWSAIVAAKSGQSANMPFNADAGIVAGDKVKMDGQTASKEQEMAMKLLNNSAYNDIASMMGAPKSGTSPVAIPPTSVTPVTSNTNVSTPISVSASNATDTKAAVMADTANLVQANSALPGNNQSANETPADIMIREMQAQTNILTEIASNTKNAGNFFAGSAPAANTSSAKNEPVSLVSNMNATINRNTKVDNSHLLVLAPSQGALAVAKGGSRA